MLITVDKESVMRIMAYARNVFTISGLLLFLLVMISSFSFADELETINVDSTLIDSSTVKHEHSDHSHHQHVDDSLAQYSESIVPDSTLTDSLRKKLGLFAADSLTVDSLALDSLALDSLNALLEKVYALFDTLTPATNYTTYSLKKSEMYKAGYKDLGEALAPLPGLFPRQKSLYKNTFYLLPPGGSGRDLLVYYQGRPYNDPVHGAVNFSALSTGEVEFANYEMAWNGSGFSSSGPVLNLTRPIDYPEEAYTEVIYRQGFYGVGDVDWRISHKLHRGFRYYIGINYGEMEGRYPNSAGVGNNVRVGGETNLGEWGTLGFYWMQGRNKVNRANSSGEQRYKRYDYDLVWRLGVPDQENYLETALWHVQSSHSYNRSGRRTGIRSLKKVKILNHQLKATVDLERVSAKLGRLPEAADPQGHRWILGAGVNDQVSYSFLNMNGGLRFELSDAAKDSIGPDDSRANDGTKELIPRMGGSFEFESKEVFGLNVIGLNSLSWRWPSINESYDRFIRVTPDHFYTPNPPNEDLILFQGDGRMKPVGGLFSGVGLKHQVDEYNEFKILAGYRQYIDPIDYVEFDTDYWGVVQGDNRDGFEVNASALYDLWGPFDLSAAFTYADFDYDAPVPTNWGRTTLGFQRHFFEDDLFLRVYLTAKYWGEYNTQRAWGEGVYYKFREPARAVYDLMIIGQIMNFELFWGINNETSAGYDFVPGYPAMFREEIWGVRWKMTG